MKVLLLVLLLGGCIEGPRGTVKLKDLPNDMLLKCSHIGGDTPGYGIYRCENKESVCYITNREGISCWSKPLNKGVKVES